MIGTAMRPPAAGCSRVYGLLIVIAAVAVSRTTSQITQGTHISIAPEDTKIVLGSLAEFPCGVNHDQAVKVDLTWTFNDRAIKLSNRVQITPEGTLKIREARNTDVGVYTCKVKSLGGSDMRSARLDLIEIPHAPTNVRAELNVAGGLVNVSWAPPFDGNSPIVRYLVEKREVTTKATGELDDLAYNDHGWTPFAANISSKQNYALLTNLRPARSYQFRVVAVNSVGKGQPSAGTNPPITLPAQPPSAPPQGVVGAAPSSTSIIVQWTQPPNEGLNGHLLGYIVRYKLAGYTETPWYYRNVTNPSQLSFLLDDLIVWRNYEVQVGAYNEIGAGAYSPSIQIRTREGQPAAAPANVHAEPINSTALKVSWNAPDPQLINGINQGYKIKAFVMTKLRNSDLFAPTLAKEVLVDPHLIGQTRIKEAILSDLHPHTNYMISVLCFTSGGDGPSNEPAINVTTLQDLPDHVAVLKFSEVFDTAIRITWAPPEHVNGELLGYTLKYAAVGQRDWRWANFSADLNETTVTGLQPNTTYTFEMHAITPVGAGPTVSASVTTTPSPVVVGELHFTDITMTGLKVSWTAPEAPNRNVTGYYVVYETAAENSAGSRPFSKQVKQKIDDTQLTVSGLEERATYTFRVRAETSTGVGPERLGTVTTGPQPGSPQPPSQVSLMQTLTSVKIKWRNQQQRQREALIGYLIEGKQVYGVEQGGNGLDTSAPDGHETKWHPIVALRNGPQHEYDLSFTHLSPSSKYTLRIMAMNSRGISEPAYPMTVGGRSLDGNATHPVPPQPSIVITPSFLELRIRPPFHREAWFVILCACMTLVITIMVVAILCVQNKAYKYKKEAQKGQATSRSGSHNALSEAGFGLGEDQTYAGLELRQHANIAGIRRSSVALNAAAAAQSAKPPPRPAPGSLTYSEDEAEYGDTTAKESNLYGSSGDSLTEKPSEMSSSGPESESSDVDDGQASGHHFVNHYANVNDTLRKGHSNSWRKQGHPYMVRPPRQSDRHRDGQSTSRAAAMDQSLASHPSRPAPPVPGRSSLGQHGSRSSSSHHHQHAQPDAAAAAPPSYLSAVAVTASEDSELESPAVNLNGGRIVVNNTAGSRMPLPGFSSFV